MRRPVPLRALALLAVALPVVPAACAEAGGSGWTVATDTLPNGAVRRVATPPASGVEPTWVLEEELRIGTLDEAGPTALGQVRGLAVTSDGRIAVLDAQAQELRLFGPGGEHLVTYGGPGEGPGELSEAYGLMRGRDDRLFVPDVGTRRMSVFHPDSGFLRTHRFPILRYGFIWGGAMASGSGEGARILKPSITLGENRRELLRVYDLEMNLVDSLFFPERPPVDEEDPPGAFYWEAPGGMRRGYMGVPFYADAQLVLDPAGGVWSTAEGDPAYRIVRWAPEGDTSLVIETRRAPVPVTAADRDTAVERIREALLERGVGADRDWSKIPERRPAVRSMFVADGGRLWVRAASPDTLLTYDVYERDGRYAGTAVGSLNVWEYLPPVVRGDRFWAVVTDELDVPYVVRARLAEAGAP